MTGLNGVLVEIEVSVLPGLPSFEISGRGDSAIRESRDRVRAAIRHSGYLFPKGRVVASYAPASLPKQGSAFDLPLALAVLASSDQAVPSGDAPMTASFGELSLNGRVKPVSGVLGRLFSLREEGIRHVIGPTEGEREASSVKSIRYEGVETLRQAVLRYSGISPENRAKKGMVMSEEKSEENTPDVLGLIRGQTEGIRACTIAAAGWHPILLMGAPGCGKTTLATAIPSILPPLSEEESVEVSRIYSAAGICSFSGGLMKRRPFRYTHHTVTPAALIGGGLFPKPGECTLAHRGVLFLDELTEVSPRTLDALREPLETGEVRLSRADWNMVFPAEFLFVAACNPCRCGYLLEPHGRCQCDDMSVRRHLSRINGPLFDRFDLIVPMTRVDTRTLLAVPDKRRERGRSLTQKTGEQVVSAWKSQKKRASARGMSAFHNGSVQVSDPEKYFSISAEAMRFAGEIADQSLFSVRSFLSLLRIARTIADIEKNEQVSRGDIAEAYHFKARLPFSDTRI